MKEARVLIAGGGIGGLVAALALNQRGFEVSLYEQAPELHELGAGVTISPNGSRVLCELGLRPAMEAIVSPLTSRHMRLFNTGETWHLPVAGAEAGSSSAFWPVHRGDLHQALANARWGNSLPEPSISAHVAWASNRTPAVSRCCCKTASGFKVTC
jgi:salicylate hydroxylase